MPSSKKPNPQVPRRTNEGDELAQLALGELASVRRPRTKSNDLLRRSVRTAMQPWTGQSSQQAWIASTIVHTAILVLIALIWQPITHGTNASGDRAVGIALVHHQQSGISYELQGGGQSDPMNSQQVAESVASATASNSPSSADVQQQFEDLLGNLAAAASGVDVGQKEAGSQGATGLQGQGSGGNTRGNAATTKTSFLGLEGQGNSFVYVLDRSDSMSAYQATPLKKAKSELVESIGSLGRVNQFQIIFYNDSASIYRGSLSGTAGLVFASDVDRRSAIEYVNGVSAVGGTDHFPALAMGLQLAPDVLFFLTDAAEPALTTNQLDRLVAMAERSGCTIHTIQFGVGTDSGDGRWIASLAEKTRGKYRYIDVLKNLD